MWKALTKWWRREGDLVVLRHLDDRLLADMGFAREDLRARVHGQSPHGDKGQPIPLNRAASLAGCAQRQAQASCR